MAMFTGREEEKEGIGREAGVRGQEWPGC